MNIDDFPLTPAEVYKLREATGFETPLKPLVEGDPPWCIFEQRGTYEFLLHPRDALDYIMLGMVVDGVRYPAQYIDCYPMIGAWHILVIDPEMNKTFLPDTRDSVRGDPDQALPEA